jgi:hypothetical protein
MRCFGIPKRTLMHRFILPLVLFCCSTITLAQQAGSEKGMLIPMMSATEMQAIDAPGQGATVFNKTAQAFYFFDGTEWRPLLSAEHSPETGKVVWHQHVDKDAPGAPKVSNGTTGFWDLTGNSGTNGTNFLGTTDLADLRLRVNNVHAGRIQAPPQLPLPDLFIPQFDHTSFGLNAGRFDGGNANSFFGSGAGRNLQDGEDNTVIGSLAMAAPTNAHRNTCVGSESHSNSSFTLECTSLGYTARPIGSLTNSTAIGAKASVSASNCLVLGSINGLNNATADVNVGIGTTSPQSALHISRGAAGAPPNGGALLVVEDNTNAYISLMTPNANESGILFGNPSGTAAGGVIYNSTAPNGLAFRTNGNVTRAVIDATGRLGVGTTSPATRVDVNGGLTIRQSATITAPVGTSTVTIGDNSYLRIASTGASVVNLSNGLATGQVLLIEGGGGTITVNDNAAVSNCNLVANRALGTNDVLSLIWNGLDWIEVGSTNN